VIRLTDHGPTTIEINIVRYQFPEIVDHEWDSNWLIVGLSASVAGKTWDAIDAAVDALELRSLANGLEKLVADQDFVLGWHPLEPCLEIEARWLESEVKLVVTLAHEFSPARSVDDEARAEFRLNLSELRQLSTEVQELSERFPVRVNRPRKR
jgi:hypothetical protein